MFAVVDIETTGGSARLERITEIAIYIHDGEQIVDEYSTLVNPERNIPYFITSMTGITNEMVEDAPKFFEVARKIVEMTEGHIFVAHNARFDYSFIRQEFSMLGYSFKRPMLDTVALSRRLLPGHRSYSLGNLCTDLGIEIRGRHRAAGDALATVKLLEMLLEKDNSLLTGSLIRNRKAAKLHPALDLSKLKDIPEEPGIYYFHDEKGELIYVGKSRNLSQRISSHLSNNTSAREMEMRSMTADISWETTGSELIALLMESSEIKKNKPRFNRAQRRTGFRWGIYSHTDEKGYIRFSYRNVNDDEVPLSLFTSRDRARGKLEQIIDQYSLCQKLCGLYETDGACFHHQVGLCRGACSGEEDPRSYNERALLALDEFIFRERNFFIIDRGRNAEERAVVKLVNGKYAGWGFFSINDVGFGLTAVHDCIRPETDNRDIQIIIKGYLKNHRVERIIDF
ncbi:MAG TPA: exonuclease domain-containing protein [Bacteroidales bacterium]|jgi:DNA polymerase-3 subunit epsilon|nr:GIY-YIG nuclease family protein [Bacteroidales bacterium]HNT92154.1 exonuclease domain-containing protein [Bacteroidales bacterium]HOO66762.1 exonuclease domain-containing protein [Bacteroidales bacterium]HPE22737.1 exonuclease domain-containing protein [Bacteroidales bacterium]HPJ05282.1 exonuclease domain-containing protein [Bacteroidales bacterium]